MSNQAATNLKDLGNNSYPGRGIVIGMDETGDFLVQVYWIMGRSENSRNRIFAADAGHVWTEAADPEKMEDPTLVIYNALREHEDRYIVTNGDQTDTIVKSLMDGGDFRDALQTREYEPDAPNCTPRISGICSLDGAVPVAELSVLKKSVFGDGCDRHLFRIEQFGKGLGNCITTYMGDGNPLPSFQGEPYLLPLSGDIHAIAETTWDALNEENRVSLAVKLINIANGQSEVVVVNKYRKV